ncbi:short-chain fatty acyl-CoA regulator family protein [Pseudochrobactrum kiredjianiae]|uniref:Short-chain fatty acyl-CoA regulator family protein n=1 Tax=Pseudochrobactrum kiredjianiae TaxID=386305 RepID=A0ABW3V6P3_9HYPH|nr:short-chain fatty acyl-CoA regulator family protein [Pseudochrobactrum kiredjianiae]MDM7850830.1 short-chain fatty acyl-CoA regulator family protein [Pseudochrobactrum kiredjianiae]
MRKTFVGIKLKKLREERQLTQMSLAKSLGISLSYLNQIENNQRPLTVQVLLRLNEAFGIDVQLFSEAEEARLFGDLREVFADPRLTEQLGKTEIRELAANMPAVGRLLVEMHKQLGEAQEQSAYLANQLGNDRSADLPVMLSTPYEEVREYFYAHRNYIPELDHEGEALSRKLGLPVGKMKHALAERLLQMHGVRLVEQAGSDNTDTVRHFDKSTRLLALSPRLDEGQQAFQLATQIAFLEQKQLLDQLLEKTTFTSPEALVLARIGLANYFAGAVLMPYMHFLQSAEQLRYDIELLEQRYAVSFETICHRLSTLQRPEARGVPFFFIRVDRAGNISKRQSATDFHFSRFGGTCPLWNIYAAFSSPDRILTQQAEMPDGRTYFWIAKMIRHRQGGYKAPSKNFAIALGCDLHHADRLVYSKGMILDDPAARTPIGAGCKICERQKCPQRAFPALYSTIQVDEAQTNFAPYMTA